MSLNVLGCLLLYVFATAAADARENQFLKSEFNHHRECLGSTDDEAPAEDLYKTFSDEEV